MFDERGERCPVDRRLAPRHRHASRSRPDGKQVAGVALEEGRNMFGCSTDPGHQSEGNEVLQGALHPGGSRVAIWTFPCSPGGNPRRLTSRPFQNESTWSI